MNVAADDAEVVRGAVVVVLALRHDFDDFGIGSATLKHAAADSVQQAHEFEFVRSEPARLVEDQIRDPDFANIMQQAGGLKDLQAASFPAEKLCPRDACDQFKLVFVLLGAVELEHRRERARC